MGRTYHICTIAGIPLKIHWSFGLTVLFVVYVVHLHQLSTSAGIGFALLTLIMFICVILHELGHSLAAQRFQIDTVDIIISPIGGLARLKDIPEQPIKELVIALAGPAVNLIIACIIAVFLYFILGTEILPSSYGFERLGHTIDFLRFVCFMNVGLFVFNLIPAFPMDGGRVLRALLSMKTNRLTATKIAMWIAKGLSILFVILAFMWNHIVLGLIAIFIYTMSGREYAYVRMMNKAKSLVASALRSQFTLFTPTDTYTSVMDQYKLGTEKNFLVVDEKKLVVGAIPEIFIKDVLSKNATPLLVSDLMSSKVAIVSPSTILRKVADMMNQEGVAICAVKKEDSIVGVIDRTAIENFIKQ